MIIENLHFNLNIIKAVYFVSDIGKYLSDLVYVKHWVRYNKVFIDLKLKSLWLKTRP